MQRAIAHRHRRHRTHKRGIMCLSLDEHAQPQRMAWRHTRRPHTPPSAPLHAARHRRARSGLMSSVSVRGAGAGLQVVHPTSVGSQAGAAVALHNRTLSRVNQLAAGGSSY